MGSSRKTTRVDGERPRDAHALGLSAREAVAAAVGEVLDAEHLEGRRRLPVQLLAVDAADAQAALHVAPHRGGEQVGLLEDGGGVAAQPQAVAAALHRSPSKRSSPLRALQPVQRAHQGRLAGAVRPQQHVHLAGLDREAVDVHERLAAPDDGEVAAFDGSGRESVTPAALRLPGCWMMVIA